MTDHMTTTPHRIAFWDVETLPLVRYDWSLKQYPGFASIDTIIKPSCMLAWGFKVKGEQRVTGRILNAEEVEERDDSRLIAELADLIRGADVIVAHNGDNFDLKKLNGRLMVMGVEPLPPMKTIDTYKLAKASISLESNKLDYLAQQLGLGGKLKTDYQLWKDCDRGDEVALRRMLRYCKKDVSLLEEVFNAMVPYSKGVPRLVDGTGFECTRCGSDLFERRGFSRTNAATYQRVVCLSCGKWDRMLANGKRRPI